MLAEDFDIKDIPQDEETLNKMKEELAAKEARAREEILAVVSRQICSASIQLVDVTHH